MSAIKLGILVQPEYVTEVAILLLWMFCGYLRRPKLASKWEKEPEDI
jgi:hypothetical protein